MISIIIYIIIHYYIRARDYFYSNYITFALLHLPSSISRYAPNPTLNDE